MNPLPRRIIIYAKDITKITGMQPDTARKLLARIRKKLGKPTSSPVTVYEFCEFMGFKLEWVLPHLE